MLSKLRPNVLVLVMGMLGLAIAALVLGMSIIVQVALNPHIQLAGEVWVIVGGVMAIPAIVASGLVGLAKEIATDPAPPSVPIEVVKQLLDQQQ